MCAKYNEKIGHAVAFCDTFVKYPEPGERSELEMLKDAPITVDGAVNVLKETVRRHSIDGSGIILKEMCTPEFKAYVAHLLNTE